MAQAAFVLICSENDKLASAAVLIAETSPATKLAPAAPTPDKATFLLMICKDSDPWFNADVRLSKLGRVVIGVKYMIAVLSKYALNTLLAVVFPIALMWIFKIPLGPIDPPL